MINSKHINIELIEFKEKTKLLEDASVADNITQQQTASNLGDNAPFENPFDPLELVAQRVECRRPAISMLDHLIESGVALRCAKQALQQHTAGSKGELVLRKKPEVYSE
jgi:hypothetical protein